MRTKTKAEITEILRRLPPEKLESAVLEVWHESRPKLYVKLNTQRDPIHEYGGGLCAGKVSKRVFGWFTWELYDKPFFNLTRYKLVSLEPSKNTLENFCAANLLSSI